MRKLISKNPQEIRAEQNGSAKLDKKSLPSRSSVLMICQTYLLGCLVLIKMIKEAIRSKISTEEQKRLK